MSALGTNRQNYHVTNNAPSSWYEPVVVSGQTVYRGALVGRFKSGASQGKVRPLTTDTTLEILGFSKSPEAVVGDGSKRVEVMTGVILLYSSGLTAADEGKIAYGTTDQDFVLTSGGGANPAIGRVERVLSATTAHVWVGPTAVAAVVIVQLGAAAAGGGAIVIFADATVQTAFPAASRYDGLLAVLLDDGTIWDFDAGSSASATDWVRVPDAGTGRWLRRQASIADLASTATGKGAALVGAEDAGGFTSAATVEAQLQEIYQHLKSTQAPVLFSLYDFREVTSGGDVGDTTANGGLLASDTTPILRGNAAETQEISWATGNTDIICAQTVLPTDFDGSANATVDLWVYSGTTNAASFTVETGWDGGSIVSDTATDGAASASIHKITATIAAADIPDTAANLTIMLTPAAHATDTIQLVGVRLNYKRKLLTS